MTPPDTWPEPPAMNTITLQTPIKRDGQTIERIELRKPTSGELRGLNLLNLLQMDVDAICTVLPRISNPIIHKPEAMAMDPADLLDVGVMVAGFLQKNPLNTAGPSE